MASDRFVYFKETPSREDIGKLLRGYIGDIRGPGTAARELQPEHPMAQLGLTDDLCMTQSRWFEVYMGDDHIDVITRMADELTSAIGQGFAELAARYWRGTLEAEAEERTRDLCKHGNAACASVREFYILDTRDAVGNCASWWRPDGSGYTTELAEAGLYDSCPGDRETDVLVPRAVAERLAVRHVRLDRLREKGVLRG